jgi:hypothetical protein
LSSFDHHRPLWLLSAIAVLFHYFLYLVVKLIVFFGGLVALRLLLWILVQTHLAFPPAAAAKLVEVVFLIFAALIIVIALGVVFPRLVLKL